MNRNRNLTQTIAVIFVGAILLAGCTQANEDGLLLFPLVSETEPPPPEPPPPGTSQPELPLPEILQPQLPQPETPEPGTTQLETVNISIQIKIPNASQTRASQVSSASTPFGVTVKVLNGTTVVVSEKYLDSNSDLTQWSGELEDVPVGVALEFVAEGMKDGEKILSGKTIKTLTRTDDDVEINLEANRDESTALPQIIELRYPSEIIAGIKTPVEIIVEGGANETLDYEITASNDQGTIGPQTGNLVLSASGQAMLSIVYDPPTLAGDYELAVYVTNSAGHGVKSGGTIKVVYSRVDRGITIQFNPLVMSLIGQWINDNLVWRAEVITAGSPTYDWGFDGELASANNTNNTTDTATLINYEDDKEGNLILTVNDNAGGSTTVSYKITPGMFPKGVLALEEKLLFGGFGHTIFKMSDGSLVVWGTNDSGVLGIGDDPQSYNPKTILDSNITNYTMVGGGRDFSCGLAVDGKLFCWGKNDMGQLGNGRPADQNENAPVQVAFTQDVKYISTGLHRHALAITIDGEVYAWGLGNYGQLGTGCSTECNTPEPVNIPHEGPPLQIRTVAAGRLHSLALTNSGKVYGWGYNGHGQVGDGYGKLFRNSPYPVAIPDGVIVVAIAAGNYHSLALTEDGEVYAWGDNRHGQLGDGNYGSGANTYTPQLVNDLAIIKSIATGGDHSLALNEGGMVYAWGRNDSRQLGVGDKKIHLFPELLGSPVRVRQIAAGLDHSLILTEDGYIYTWGDNSNGELGVNNIDFINVPTKLNDLNYYRPDF